MKRFILIVILLLLTGCGSKICWECYDGATDCKNYDEPKRELAQPDADFFCKGKCNAEGVKCGVNVLEVKK